MSVPSFFDINYSLYRYVEQGVRTSFPNLLVAYIKKYANIGILIKRV